MKKLAFCREKSHWEQYRSYCCGQIPLSWHVCSYPEQLKWRSPHCCTFLYSLAACNAKIKKIPGCFSDRELQEEFTAQQPNSARPPSLPAALLPSSLWGAAALYRISGDCETLTKEREPMGYFYFWNCPLEKLFCGTQHASTLQKINRNKNISRGSICGPKTMTHRVKSTSWGQCFYLSAFSCKYGDGDSDSIT